MQKKRVVITGLGLVSCFGTDVDAFYQALLAGRSGVVPIEEFPCADYPTRFAAPIRGLEVGEYMDKKQARRVDPYIRYAMIAGKRALEMGRLDPKAVRPERCGIIIGSGMGGMQVFHDGVETLLKQGVKRITPFFVPFIITNMAGGMLAMDLNFQGPNYSISTACATANNSIFAAAEHIRAGHADLMLCGGSEAAINPIGVGGFVACKALSERNDEPAKASRPFDKGRDGFVMGEGAGVLLLESLEHALARGAPILAEYLGGAINCDAFHITAPREDGAVVGECMEKALRDAGVAKEGVQYINAHATSTPAGDLCELRAVKRVFGPHCNKIKINSTKSMTGHCLGAAGGVEAIATIQAIRTGKVHPTINLDQPEEELGDLDPVAHVAQDHTVDVALSNSFGFGGHNSCLVLGRYDASR